MKARLLITLFTLCALFQATAQTTVPVSIPTKDWAIADPEDYRTAGKQAIDSLFRDFVALEDLGMSRVAILPLVQDAPGNYLTLVARNSLVEQGRPHGITLYNRSDAAWKKLLEEIKFGQQMEDVMDPSTVQKFGDIKGVEGILIGRVIAAEQTDTEVRVRVLMQAFNVTTGQQIWGKETLGKIDLPEAAPEPEPEKKLVDVPDTLIELPGNAQQRFWVLAGLVGGVVLLILVLLILRSMRSKHRPR